MKEALEEYDMTWRQYFDGKGWENEVSQYYGVTAIPATYLVGPEGKVVGNNLRGPRLEAAVKEHLTEEASE